MSKFLSVLINRLLTADKDIEAIQKRLISYKNIAKEKETLQEIIDMVAELRLGFEILEKWSKK